ncbi:MAG: hypothetical protein SVK08_02470 [Halobacteriota archaeon]|nr:hypothetical protein [Halobacteriota archaeon]
MAKVKTIKIEKKNKAGVRITFDSTIYLNPSNGDFSALIDKGHEGDFQLLEKDLIDHGCYLWNGKKRGFKEPRFFVVGDKLGKVISAIEAVLGKLLEVEVIEEEVILYAIEKDIHFAYTDDGKVFFSGYEPKELGYQEDEWNWNENTHDQFLNLSKWAIGLRAVVAKKKTYISPNGDSKIEYDRICEGEFDKEKSPWGIRLNRALRIFVGSPDQYDEVREIPYTETRAQFFAESMLSLARVCRKLDEFLGDPKEAIKKIDSGNIKMLEGG